MRIFKRTPKQFNNITECVIDDLKQVLDSLFSVGETSALTYNIKGLDDFELICFLVIK